MKIRNLKDLCVISVLILAFASWASAEEFFAHGAAGGQGLSFQTELVIASDELEVGINIPREVEGEVFFFDQEGDALSLLVTGQILNGANPVDVVRQPMTGFRYRVRFGRNFVMEKNDTNPVPFWTRIAENDGQVRASLKFALLDEGRLVSQADVPSGSPRVNHSFSVIGGTAGGELRLTGLAIVNSSPTQTNQFSATAIDLDGVIVASCDFNLPPRGQTAQFVNELFAGLPADFSGAVLVESQRNSVSVSLLQSIQVDPPPTTITLSVISTQPGELLPSDNFNSQASSLGGLGGTGGGGLITFDPGIDLRGNGGGGGIGTVTLTNTQTQQVLNGIVAEDGGILISSVPSGEWLVRIDVPGFIPFERLVDFPTAGIQVFLTPLAFINPDFLERTLGDNALVQGSQSRVFKPAMQFKFIFDLASFGRSTDPDMIEKIRSAFRQWVFFELPQIGVKVEGSEGEIENLGGRDNYQEGNFPQPFLNEMTLLVAADSTLRNSLISKSFLLDPQTSEIRGATLLFNPALFVDQTNCDPNEDFVCDTPRIVAAFLWDCIFFRNFRGLNVNDEGVALTGLPGETLTLDSVFTHVTSNPKGFSAPGYDRNYWRLLARRPAGTSITSERERLPKSNLGQSANTKRRKLIRIERSWP